MIINLTLTCWGAATYTSQLMQLIQLSVLTTGSLSHDLPATRPPDKPLETPRIHLWKADDGGV